MVVEDNINNEKTCVDLGIVTTESDNMLEPFSEETSFLLVNELKEHDSFKAKSLSIAGGKVVR